MVRCRQDLRTLSPSHFSNDVPCNPHMYCKAIRKSLNQQKTSYCWTCSHQCRPPVPLPRITKVLVPVFTPVPVPVFTPVHWLGQPKGCRLIRY